MKEILIAVAVSATSGALTGFLFHLLNRKKLVAEVSKIEIETNSILIKDSMAIVNALREEFNEQKSKIKELEEEVLMLKQKDELNNRKRKGLLAVIAHLKKENHALKKLDENNAKEIELLRGRILELETTLKRMNP